MLALFDHWRSFPPVNESAAAFFGIKPREHVPEPRLSDDADPSGIGLLISQFPDGSVPAQR